MAGINKVKIAARLRPHLQGEHDDGTVKIQHSSDNIAGTSTSLNAASSFIVVTNPRDTSQVFKFPFSSCYDHNSTQEEIFRNDVEPLIDEVYGGITVTIFAYGVTSSGKTHTMQGTKSNPGVIPRVVKAMFDKQTSIQNSSTSLSVSYMEIYKDDVYDLLVTRENAPKLPVRENDSGMVFVANLTSIKISSVEEFDTIYNRATKHRSVGATNLNHASSRSHAVLTIEVNVTDHATNTTLSGKMNLVDLAGSENNRLTGNDPSRMAESAAINKSLSVLGQVVHALNQGASRIPYRNSKLTRILQDALGGSSIGLLICNLAPGVKFRQDTLNTLNFAVRTKNIENKPVVHERENYPSKTVLTGNPFRPSNNKSATLAVQEISASGVNITGPTRSRASLVPISKVPRRSTGYSYQPFAALSGRREENICEKIEENVNEAGNVGAGLTEKEIDERISRAVEAEVTRRLAERERESENQRHLHENSSGERNSEELSQKDHSLPSGVLTPLLKRHKDLDDELKMRLLELEKKLDRGSKEIKLAEVLSPISKKKTGRAYVALARAHSEKGDLQVALDLYRKAESYVPDNIKLKERIIEIEWAVNNNKEFIPSPKVARKSKSKRQAKAALAQEKMEVDEMDGGFGAELTNTDSPNKSKRSFAEIGESAHTPSKRQRKAKAINASSDNEDMVPPAPVKENRRQAAA